MYEYVLDIKNLKTGYDKKTVLKGLSFVIKKGEMVGLIGSNGAGKSTIIKVILGIMPLHQGQILINGQDIEQRKNKVKSYTSYIPELPVLYDELTLIEHMRFTAMLHDIDRQTFEQRAKQLIDMFEMRGKEYDFPNSFSKGMKQKVMVMCAFLYNPILYLVDEPFLGLDPKAIKSLINLLNSKKKEGASVLLSTHILDTAQKICDRFIIIEHGRLLASGNLQELNRQAGLHDADLTEIYDKLVELDEK
ncbi:MAG: ABC transporter ATP-binding protein [Clostridia bacterium]|nr:ABC transporter ATP-binding protein [Clostridia bacterium]